MLCIKEVVGIGLFSITSNKGCSLSISEFYEICRTCCPNIPMKPCKIFALYFRITSQAVDSLPKIFQHKSGRCEKNTGKVLYIVLSWECLQVVVIIMY